MSAQIIRGNFPQRRRRPLVIAALECALRVVFVMIFAFAWIFGALFG